MESRTPGNPSWILNKEFGGWGCQSQLIAKVPVSTVQKFCSESSLTHDQIYKAVNNIAVCPGVNKSNQPPT